MVKKLDQLSPDERDSFMRLWVNKAVKVKAVAARFGVSERTARDWAKECRIERGGRGYGGAARQPRIAATPWAGQETKADPDSVYDRETLSVADRLIEDALDDLGEATAHAVARAALDKRHSLLSDFARAWVLTDESEFVTSEPPAKVSSSGADMKSLTLRVTRRLARHKGDGPKEKPR